MEQTIRLSGIYISKVFARSRGDWFRTEIPKADFTPEIYRMIEIPIERFKEENTQGKKNRKVRNILSQLAEQNPVPATALSPAPPVENDSTRGLSRLNGEEDVEQLEQIPARYDFFTS